MLELEPALALLTARNPTGRPEQALEVALDRSDASALADLQMHWDEAYVIGLDGDIWSARYRDSTDDLRAHTCTELRELIRADYSYRARAHPTREQEGAADPGGDDGAAGDAGAVRDDNRREQPQGVNFAAIRGERMST